MDTTKESLRIIQSVILICLLSLQLQMSLGLGADRISADQSLSGDQTILSSEGQFRLGFFTPGNSNYYIGMWYNRVPKQNIVWVANRERPVRDKFLSELRISDGNLVLFNESKVPIWSTSMNSTISDSLEAVLLDQGNLVLRRVFNDSSSVDPLWQSFDYPTDTWLPGAKIGFNKITKKNTFLTSWRSKEDPAPGLFSLLLDPNDSAQYFIYYNMSHRFWSSGPWNGRFFTNLPELDWDVPWVPTMNLNFTFVDNVNESYFTFYMHNSSFITRNVMYANGQVRADSWSDSQQEWNLFWSVPRVQCEVYGYCGSFGSCNVQSQPFCHCLAGFGPKSMSDWNAGIYSEGCVRRTNQQCGNSSLVNEPVDKFSEVNNVQAPDNAQRLEAVLSLAECESKCLSNCSCIAYAYNDNQCLVWSGELLNLNQLVNTDPQAQTIYIRLAASEFSSSKDNRQVVIGSIIGSSVIVAILGVVVFIILRRKRAAGLVSVVGSSLMTFTYRDLQQVTKNFSEKLGEGGFGSVFKGTLPDLSAIAVKKLEGIGQGEKQFRTEVSTIGTIQHVNLVRLRGFCSESAKRLLVYDYMPNGSLDSHLFGDKGLKILDWKTRYQISVGIARGLSYLHEKCRDSIIHCDIKPENILLDADYCPKIADFGLAKLIGRDFSRVLTTIRGTRGYLAPEWLLGVAITTKADVYSFGMMLFELVSGRRNSEQSEDGTVKFFPALAATQLVERGDLLSLLDPSLEGNADADEVMKICEVACWCIQDDEIQRPPMSFVVQILEGVSNVSMPPFPRSLQALVDHQEPVIFYTNVVVPEEQKE